MTIDIPIASGWFIVGIAVGLTASIAVGSIPGVLAGSPISSRADGRVIRPVLAFVLVATGLKLLGVATTELAVVLLALPVLAALGVGPRSWAPRVGSRTGNAQEAQA